MKDAVLIELADIWDIQAANERDKGAREAKRECADTLRSLVQAATPKDCPHAAPFRYCARCVVSPCPIGLVQVEDRP